MNPKQLYHKCKLPILAFLAAWASLRACRLGTFHIFGGLFFLLYFLLGRQFFKWDKVRTASVIYRRCAVLLSALFTFFYLCADYGGLLGDLTSRLFRFGYLLISGAGLFILFYTLLLSFFLWAENISLLLPPEKIRFRYYEKLPVIGFFFCLLAWLPYLLTNYPGVMTVDSLNQYGQIIGQLPMSNHHPWVHTQLIRLFYELGMALTGDAITGLGLFTIFQMLVMADIFAYLTGTLTALHVRPGICFAVLAFYSLLPYNAIYMVTMWKDILFSGMVLLFSTILFRFLIAFLYKDKMENSIRVTAGTYVLYTIAGFGMCLFRSNGFHAFLLTLPFLLLCFRKVWKKHVFVNVIILLSVLFIKGPVMNYAQVASPDFVEALSIPIQLTARVYADGEPVSEEDNEMWNRIMDTSKIPETYESFCSDHMKNLIRTGDASYLETHKIEYLKLWLRFGLSHPLAYLRGYIDATKGYWYPDVPNIIGSDERIAENPYGLTARPLIHNPLTIKIKEIVFKLPDMVPLYGLLFSLGAMFWLCILLAGNTYLTGNFKYFIVFLPNAAIMATLFLATPVNNEFRYAYSMLLTMPLFLLCAFPVSPPGDN